MGSRRQSRELCLQALYLWDNCGLGREESWQIATYRHIIGDKKHKTDHKPLYPQILAFADELLKGIVANREHIDSLIQQYCHNWKLERMSAIDRNILRIGIYEITSMPQIPVNVIINEAVEIAKFYSTQESGKFVNGILDKIKHERKP